jgi:hypothetical protein
MPGSVSRIGVLGSAQLDAAKSVIAAMNTGFEVLKFEARRIG